MPVALPTTPKVTPPDTDEAAFVARGVVSAVTSSGGRSGHAPPDRESYPYESYGGVD